jgi:DNA-binding SARP family transcriptional activator
VLIQVLGHVRVTESGTTIALPGAIPARILALLTTNLEHGLGTDALVDGVWGDAARDAATATLQSHVARLRRAIGADLVVTTTYGYRLAVPAAAVDAHQFSAAAERGAALLQDGRAAEAADVLKGALALWRGEAYDGLADCPPLARERARLSRLRLDSTISRIEAELAADLPGSRTSEIERLIEEHPTNERLWALLMRAWQAAGDSAAALTVFRQARDRLLDELGLEPGARLRSIQAELLAGDGPGEPAVRTPRAERRRVSVVAVCEADADDDPEVAQVARTRMLTLIEHEVTRLGGVVVPAPGAVALAVFGAQTTREDDPHRALLGARRIADATGTRVGVASGLAIVTPALDQLGAVVDRALARAVTAGAGEVVADPEPSRTGPTIDAVPMVGRSEELARLSAAVSLARRRRRTVVVPVLAEAGIGKTRLLAEARRALEGVRWFQAQCDALGERGALEPLADALRHEPTDPPAAASTRAEALAGWSTVLSGVAADGATVLAIEDAHWASELLLDLVDLLAAQPLRVPLVVVVTARPEIGARRPGWLASSHPLRLRALDGPESVALVQAVLAHVGSAATDPGSLAARSGGVPLFMVELGRALTSDSDHRIPARLSDLMAARIDSLDPAARDLLASASIVGSTFWAETIDARESPGLAVLLDREFIGENRPSTIAGATEYRFRHDLIREAAYQRLLRADRAAGHLATARWWLDLARGQDDAIAAEHAWLAHVAYEEAGLPDEALSLALTTSAAAGRAARGVDAKAAVTLLRRATALSEGLPDEGMVLVELAEALAENRQLEEADLVLVRARERVDPADGPARIRAAFLAIQLDFALGRPQDIETLDRLLADFPEGPVHIHTLGVSAVSLVIMQTPDGYSRALELSERAIAMASALGDEDLAVLAFATRGRSRLGLGDERGLADMDRAQQRGPGLLPPFIVLGTRQWYAGAAHHWRGPAAELEIREGLEDYARRTGMEFLVGFGFAERLRCLWELGRLEECVAAADAIDRGSDAMTRWVVVQRALALADLGRLDDATLSEVVATPPADDTDARHVIGTAVVRARHALDRGDVAGAVAVLTGLGDLAAYVARDGAAEFLPRVLRLAREAGLDGFGSELRDAAFEETPLGRALTATVRGLARDDRELLRDAVLAWQELGDSVDLELARGDAR